MDRQLLNYYPEILREFQEYREVAGAEQPEVERLWDSLAEALDNQFVAGAGEYGVGRWEKILGILPKGTETLEQRKFRILTRLSEQLPYTLRMLENQLEALCGKDRYTAKLEYEAYKLVVRVSLMARGNLSDVEDLLNRIVPVNLIIDLSLDYNRHRKLEGFTHRQLSCNTHDRLRNEVVISG